MRGPVLSTSQATAWQLGIPPISSMEPPISWDIIYVKSTDLSLEVSHKSIISIVYERLQLSNFIHQISTVCTHACMLACFQRTIPGWEGSVLSFCYVGSKVQTQVIRLVSKPITGWAISPALGLTVNLDLTIWARLTGQRTPGYGVPQCSGYNHRPQNWLFNMSFGVLRWGPHACMADTLPTEPPPQFLTRLSLTEELSSGHTKRARKRTMKKQHHWSENFCSHRCHS